MPRVFTVTKNKSGAKYKCGKCAVVIQAGEKYHYFTPYKSSKRIRCQAHYPRPSELTGSQMLSTVYGIQESIEDACASVSDGQEIVDALESASGEVESLIGELEDKISNLENAFPNGCPSLEILNEYRNNAEAFKDAIGSAKDEAESRWQEFESEEEPDEEDKDAHTEWESKRDDAISDVANIAGEIDCQF